MKYISKHQLSQYKFSCFARPNPIYILRKIQEEWTKILLCCCQLAQMRELQNSYLSQKQNLKFTHSSTMSYSTHVEILSHYPSSRPHNNAPYLQYKPQASLSKTKNDDSLTTLNTSSRHQYNTERNPIIQYKYNAASSRVYKDYCSYGLDGDSDLLKTTSKKRIKTMYDEPSGLPMGAYSSRYQPCRSCEIINQLNSQIVKDLASKQKKVRELIGITNDLQIENSNLKAKLKVYEEEYERLLEKLKTKRTGARHYNYLNSASDQSMGRLSEGMQISCLKNSSAQTQASSYANFQKIVKQLERRIEDLKEKHAMEEEQNACKITDLKQQLYNGSKTSKQIEGKLKEADNLLKVSEGKALEMRASYEKQVLEYKTALEQVITDISQKDTIINTLKIQMSQLKSTLEDSRASAQEKIEQFRKQLKEAQSEKKSLIQRMQLEKEQLNSQLCFWEASNKEQNLNIQKLASRLEKQQCLLDKVQTEIQASKDLKMHIEALQRQNEQLRVKNAKTNTEASQCSHSQQHITSETNTPKLMLEELMPIPILESVKSSESDTYIEDVLIKQYRISELEEENKNLRQLLWKHESDDSHSQLKKQLLSLENQYETLLEENYQKNMRVTQLEKLLQEKSQ